MVSSLLTFVYLDKEINHINKQYRIKRKQPCLLRSSGEKLIFTECTWMGGAFQVQTWMRKGMLACWSYLDGRGRKQNHKMPIIASDINVM